MKNFDLSSVLTLMALLLAFFQLIKPITLFRLQLYLFGLRESICLISIGTVCIFIGIGFSYFITDNSVHVTWSPDFWEMIGGVLILSGLIILIWNSFKSSKFTKLNCSRYFKGCCRIIARNDKNDMLEFSEEITPSLNSIANYIRSNNDKVGLLARKILFLLSDSCFCNAVASHNPFFSLEILRVCFEKEVYKFYKDSKTVTDQILLRLFSVEDSILYRTGDVQNLIFSKVSAVVSDYRPLQILDKADISCLNTKNIKKYFEVVFISIRAYLNNQKFLVLSSEIESHVHTPYYFFDKNELMLYFSDSNNERTPIQFSENERSELLNGRNQSEAALHEVITKIHIRKQVIGSVSYAAIIGEVPLRKIAEVMKCKMLNAELINECIKSLIWLLMKIDLIDVSLLNAHFLSGERSFIEERTYKSLSGAIATGLDEIIESLSLEQSNESFERSRLLLYQIYHEDDDTTIIGCIREKLTALLISQIDKNIDRQYYPAVTPHLINYFGLGEINDNLNSLHVYLLNKLKHVYKKSYEKNSQIAESMLPPDTIFDKDKNLLIRQISIGRGRSRDEMLKLV